MISDAVRDRQHELIGCREPFVTATVVRVQRPTNAAAGNVALVRGDGTLEGFVGGICALHSVRLYALKVMQSGEPLLLKIVPDPTEPEPDDREMSDGQVIDTGEGSVTVRNPCLSGGAIEVFLEPTLPAPRVLVVGDSPITAAVQHLGPLVDVEVVVSAGRRDPVSPRPGDLALIVAAHGRDELEALRAGAEAGLPYLGLVASPKRGAAVLQELRAGGSDPDVVARIDTPAGIEIGAATAGEIALSILAKVISVRRGVALPDTKGLQINAHEAVSPAPVPASAPTAQTAVDPICGMTVVIDADTPRSERDGETFYFCCDGCERSFQQQAA